MSAAIRRFLDPWHPRQPITALLTLTGAVPPPALEFLVKRAPVIIAVERDAVVVDGVAVHEWKDTRTVNKIWKRRNMPGVGQACKGN